MHESKSPDVAIDRVFRQLRTLRQHRRQRDRHQLFPIEGIRQFVQAADAGFHFDSLIYSEILLQNGVAQRAVRQLRRQGVRVFAISPERFRVISNAQHASGIAAIVRQRWTALNDDLAFGRGWLIVEEIRNPGNLGTILRTAEAVGMSGAIFVGPQASDPYDPAVVRAAMGGIFRLPLLRATARELGIWLARHDIPAIGLSPRADRLWTQLPSARQHALFLGEERQGLSPILRRLCDTEVRLPMSGGADSLNVAVAAGVMMYELVRTNSAM